MDYPWIKSPAQVTAFTKGIRIQFSGPVDRGSVEERVAESVEGSPYALDWLSDQEAWPSAMPAPSCSWPTR